MLAPSNFSWQFARKILCACSSIVVSLQDMLSGAVFFAVQYEASLSFVYSLFLTGLGRCFVLGFWFFLPDSACCGQIPIRKGVGEIDFRREDGLPCGEARARCCPSAEA